MIRLPSPDAADLASRHTIHSACEAPPSPSRRGPARGWRLLDIPLRTWGRIRADFERTEKTKSLLTGSLGTMLIWVGSLGIRMLMGITLTRLLGAHHYGVYAYAITWMASLLLPTMLGFDHITLRYASIYKEKGQWPHLAGLLRFALGILLAVSSLATLMALATVAILGPVGHELRVTLAISFAILPIVVLAQLRQSLLRGLDHPLCAQIPENIVYPAVFILYLLLVWSFGGSAMTAPLAALANAGAWVTAFCIGAALLRWKLPEPLRDCAPEYERPQWLDMVPSLILSGAAYHLVSRGDIIVLGLFGTSREVGIYAASSRLSEQIMQLVYTAVSLSGASLFSSIYASGDIGELQRFTQLMTRSILWLSLPVYLCILAFAPWLLGLFGPEFVAGSAVLRLLSTTFYCASLCGFVIVMLYNTGHQRDVAVAMTTFGLLNLGLSFLLIPPFGMMGAAASSGATLLLLHGTLALVLYKRVGIISLPFLSGGARISRSMADGSTGRSAGASEVQ